MEHEPEKAEPVHQQDGLENNEVDDEEKSYEHDIADELPEHMEETENDQQYQNMFLDDIVKALKYHPELLQNLLDGILLEFSNTFDNFGLNKYTIPSLHNTYISHLCFLLTLEQQESSDGLAYPAKPGYVYGEHEDDQVPVQPGIYDMDATDLEAAIRAELMAATKDNRYGYDDPAVRNDDAKWQRYYNQGQSSPANVERYQVNKCEM